MFHATNFTVTLALLLGFTVFTIVIRQRKPLETNVPLAYWVMVLLFTLGRAEETFAIGVLLVGLAASLLLRFEFMNNTISRIVRTVEMLVWGYILIRGINVLFAY